MSVLTASDLLRFANDGWVIAVDHELKPFLIVASNGPAVEYLAFTKAFSSFGDYAYGLARRALAELVRARGRARLDSDAVAGDPPDLAAAIGREGIPLVGATSAFSACCWKLLRALKKSPRVADLAICARNGCGRYILRSHGSTKHCGKECRERARTPRDNAALMRKKRAERRAELEAVYRRFLNYPPSEGPVPTVREMKLELRSRQALPHKI